MSGMLPCGTLPDGEFVVVGNGLAVDCGPISKFKHEWINIQWILSYLLMSNAPLQTKTNYIPKNTINLKEKLTGSKRKVRLPSFCKVSPNQSYPDSQIFLSISTNINYIYLVRPSRCHSNVDYTLVVDPSCKRKSHHNSWHEPRFSTDNSSYPSWNIPYDGQSLLIGWGDYHLTSQENGYHSVSLVHSLLA